jgi:peptidoglycan/LPS O-acetylase OafA/YrhL
MKTDVAGASHKFEILDALRGVAAIIVVLVHTTGLMGSNFFPHGYLAVDFFFVLSGFVLTFAYQQKLDAGLSTLAFLKLRLIRLYPLYLVGLLIGFAFVSMRAGVQHSATHPTAYLLQLLPNLFFLPVYTSTAGVSAFPFDLAAWSLFFELVANLMHAHFLRRRSNRFLSTIVVLAASLVMYSAFRRGSLDFGQFSTDIAFGFERVLFSYTAGILLFRCWASVRHRVPAPSPFVPGILLVMLLAIPLSIPANPFFEIIAVLLGFPAIVLTAACCQPSSVLRPVAAVLGTASYAIYILHFPLTKYFGSAWRIASHHELPSVDAPWPGLVFLPLIIVVALLMDRFYDIPVRRALSRNTQARFPLSSKPPKP